MQKVVEEAEEKRAHGVLFDIEGNYVTLASNLSLLESNLPIYVCMPFWLEEELQEQIIKEVDGVVVMNYSKGNERLNIQCINRREFAICTDFFRHFAGDFLPPCRDSLPPRQFS